MHIATDRPGAQWNGDQVIVTIPSGRDTIEIALPLNYAAALAHRANRAQKDGFAHQRYASNEAAEQAHIIAFPTSVPSLARRERQIADIMRCASIVANPPA
jgi:hypothetical protein